MPYDVKRVELATGVSLPYVEQGDPSGIPVLLLHGFAGSWRSFLRVLPHLPPWMHVFAMTQRGHGEASHPIEGYGVQDLAADIAAFLEALQLPEAIIVGHSMGASVALRFGVDYSEQALGLVLVGTRANMRDGEVIAEAIAGCRRKVYPEVGHEAHAETPERLAPDLVAFCREQGTSI